MATELCVIRRFSIIACGDGEDGPCLSATVTLQAVDGPCDSTYCAQELAALLREADVKSDSKEMEGRVCVAERDDGKLRISSMAVPT
jgi:hypothetical protein